MPSQDLKGKLLITFEDSLILTSLNFLWKEVLERLSALVGERAINLHILRWHSHKKDPLALLPSQIDRMDQPHFIRYYKIGGRESSMEHIYRGMSLSLSFPIWSRIYLPVFPDYYCFNDFQKGEKERHFCLTSHAITKWPQPHGMTRVHSRGGKEIEEKMALEIVAFSLLCIYHKQVCTVFGNHQKCLI